jgi:hypothetical protein
MKLRRRIDDPPQSFRRVYRDPGSMGTKSRTKRKWQVSVKATAAA